MEGPFRDMEQHNKVPRGFLALFFGLVAWGVYCIAAYTPEISGWSQYRVVSEEIAAERAKARELSRTMRENPYERDEKAVMEGRGIYLEKCAGCHGEDLKGGDGPSLVDHLKYGEQDNPMFDSISGGRPGGMPGFDAELGRDRIWKVLAYVDSVREYGKKP